MESKHARLLLQRCLVFTASDESRPILTTINLLQRGGAVLGSASDGFILCIQSVPAKVSGSLGKEGLNIPHELAKQVLKIAANDDTTFRIEGLKSKVKLVFHDGEGTRTTLQAPHTPGTFPDYQQTLLGGFRKWQPAKSDGFMALNADLLARVARAVKFDRDGSGTIHWYFMDAVSPAVALVGPSDTPFMAVVMPMFTEDDRALRPSRRKFIADSKRFVAEVSA